MPPAVCSKLIMYWQLPLLQTKANQPVPEPRFSPSMIWNPTLFISCGIIPYFSLKSYVLLNRWRPWLKGGTARVTEEPVRPGRVLWLLPTKPLCAWHGSSTAPLQGRVRGDTAVWDFQILQRWDCRMTRARHLSVTSSLQMLMFKNSLASNNSSFTEPMNIEHIICAFILWLFGGTLSGRTVSIKHAVWHLWLSWKLTSLHMCLFAYTIHLVPKEWDGFLNWSKIWSTVFIAHIGWTLICRKSLRVENLAKTHAIEWISCCAWINEAYTVA